MATNLLSSKEKALRINLDPSIYGSFAEIGAGQETAAVFFKAGGASGTIAKTMSAYDMTFSDAIYGTSSRYVCEERLIRMLDKEYSLLEKRLPERAGSTRFFAFANTVEAINFKRTNQGHGWLGVKFQLRPESAPNECIIHVLLKENDPVQQQHTVGIIGANLLHACYHEHDEIENMLFRLMDGLDQHRAEIHFFRLDGPDFEHIDNRLCALKLVSNGLTKATMFGPDGTVLQPADELYKKNILLLRGRFRPVTHVNMDMMQRGMEQFKEEADVEEKRILPVAELTLSNLYLQNEGKIDEKDFLDRVDILCSLGQNVMISNYQEFYKLLGYLGKYNKNYKIGVIVGVYNLESIFDEKYYADLQGGILQAFGTLFGNNNKLYIYPSFGKTDIECLVSCDDLNLPRHLKQLYSYFRENNFIEPLEVANQENLRILSDDVVRMIKAGESGWEQMVPQVVVDAVKQNCLFEYPCEPELHKAQSAT